MPKLGIRKATKMARNNAAALIECLDLAQLYGDDYREEDEEILALAQRQVVRMLLPSVGDKRP